MTKMVLNSTNDDVTLGQISAMLRQEENGYQTCDYLSAASSATAAVALDIDPDCRQSVVEWCYNTMDSLKFNHETVAIAMNLLDRFAATKAGLLVKSNAETFQLAAMTCLYTATKLFEPEVIDPEIVSRLLSRNLYSPQEVEAMEVVILQALSWRVNPPTAMAFVRLCLDLVPPACSLDKIRPTLLDLVTLQTEWAVAECDFLNVKPSLVAYGALMNALTVFGLQDELQPILVKALLQEIRGNDQTRRDEALQVQLCLARIDSSGGAMSPLLSSSSPGTTTKKLSTAGRGKKNATTTLSATATRKRQDAARGVSSPRSIFAGFSR